MPITAHMTKIEALTATIQLTAAMSGDERLTIKNGKVYDDGVEVGRVENVDYANTHK